MRFIAILGVLLVLASCSDSDMEYNYHGTTIECLFGTYKLLDDSRVEETSYNYDNELEKNIIDVIKINDFTFDLNPGYAGFGGFYERLNFKDKTILPSLSQASGKNEPQRCQGMITPEMLRDIDWDAN